MQKIKTVKRLRKLFFPIAGYKNLKILYIKTGKDKKHPENKAIDIYIKKGPVNVEKIC